MLGRAIQVVTDAYRPLGIGIAWIEQPVPASAVPTIHVTLRQRSGQRTEDEKIIGINAAGDPRARVHLAHILYQRIDDDVATGRAPAYVLAHVIRGALSNGATAASMSRLQPIQQHDVAVPFADGGEDEPPVGGP